MRTGWTLSARAAVPAFRWPFERSARVRVEDRALHVVEDEAERAQERSFERVNPIPPGPKLGKPPYSFQAGAHCPDLCIEWLCGNQSRHVRSYNGRSSSGADAQIRLRVGSAWGRCGPGNSAELLAHRFPMRGSSASTPRTPCSSTRATGRQTRFVKQDIASWEPNEQPDLIFANAALHFLPDHDRLFARLASYLAPDGVLAAQMPNNARESSHALMRMVAAEGSWSSRLVPIAKTQPLIAEFEDYYGWLRPICSRVDV